MTNSNEFMPVAPMKYFVVKLNLCFGEFEKSSTHLVQATCSNTAKNKALINECHNDLNDGAYFEEGVLYDVNGEFAYTVHTCEEVKPEHIEIVKLYI